MCSRASATSWKEGLNPNYFVGVQQRLGLHLPRQNAWRTQHRGCSNLVVPSFTYTHTSSYSMSHPVNTCFLIPAKLPGPGPFPQILLQMAPESQWHTPTDLDFWPTVPPTGDSLFSQWELQVTYWQHSFPAAWKWMFTPLYFIGSFKPLTEPLVPMRSAIHEAMRPLCCSHTVMWYNLFVLMRGATSPEGGHPLLILFLLWLNFSWHVASKSDV